MIPRLRSFLPLAMLASIVVTQLQTATFAQQEKSKVVAMLSVSSIDQLLDNVAYLSEAAGQEMTGQMASMFVKENLAGVDFTNPIGMVLRTDGQDWIPVGFVPVTDLGAVFESLENTGMGAPRDLGNGIKEIPGFQPVFIKEQGGWAFVGTAIESMDGLPQNPVALLGQMPNEYDIALRGNIQNVPKEYINMAVNALQDGVRQGLESLPDEDREGQQAMVEAQMKQMETFIKESDKITIGWKTERANKRTFIDMTFTAVPGGELAKQMKTMADAKSDFSDFLLPDAAFTMNLASEIPPEQIKASVDMLEQIKATAMKEIDKDDDIESPEARRAAKEMAGAALDIFISTIRSGKMDGGASVVLKPGKIAFLGGFHVSNGNDVEQILRRAAKLGENEAGFPGIKFNADRMGNVSFHTMSMPVPDDDEARKVLGDTMEMAVGTSDDSAFIGFGRGCLGQLKSIIGSQTKQKKVAPFQMTFALKPIMEFVVELEDNPIVGSVVEALENVEGKDHLKLLGIPVENGFTYRIEIEEGVIGAIGAAAEIASGGGF